MKFIPSVIGMAGVAIAAVGAIAIVPQLTTPAEVRQLLATKVCPDCNLQSANLQQRDLTHANLQNANLQGANLQGARLGQANLKGANLQGANLEGADLGCAAVNFDFKATEQGATLNVNVNQQRPGASGSRIFGLNLNANPQGATLRFNLNGCADLADARLQGARLPDGQIHP